MEIFNIGIIDMLNYKTTGGIRISQEKELAGIFLKTLEQLAHHLDDIAYQNKKIGRRIFILNYINNLKPCNMKDLIKDLNLPPSTATRQVDYLVQNKFIIRDTPSHNRRTVELKLSKLGDEVVKWFNQHLTTVITTTLEDFSESDISITNRVLQEIAKISDQLLIPYKVD